MMQRRRDVTGGVGRSERAITLVGGEGSMARACPSDGTEWRERLRKG